ncbi:hypothetical protein KAW38_04260 [Candidatus Micrarchaeota archaeon]|nr:hypothetical protein [Candidatus Micrarchaeota archaeon]
MKGKKGFKNGTVFLKAEIEKDLQENMEKFKDPLVLAEIAYRLLEERESTNRILKNILARIEQLEKREPTETRPMEEIILPEIDNRIVNFVEKKKKATAEQVQKKFGYKGRNAASSRLNKLCSMQILKKRQVGRKVYFLRV